MPKEKESKEKQRSDIEEKIEEIEERMRNVGTSEELSEGLARPPLLSRTDKLKSGPERKAMIETMKELSEELKEIKNYTKEILNILKKQEK